MTDHLLKNAEVTEEKASPKNQKLENLGVQDDEYDAGKTNEG